MGRLAGSLALLVMVSAAMAPVPGEAAKSDADLLKELEGEAQKIDGGGGKAAPADAEQKAGEKGGGSADEGADFPKGLSEEEFGKELKRNYSGTYTFYMKLATHIREEIYMDYKKGSTIDQIRAKISERTMSR